MRCWSRRSCCPASTSRLWPSPTTAREKDAAEAVARNARVAEEHALKVFDLNVTLNERIVDLLDGLDPAAIRRDGAAIHQRLKSMSGGYPQVAAASVFGPDGKLLATSCAFPVPDVSVATREDFGGLRNNRTLEQVSCIMIGRVAGETVFNTAVARRTPAGKFDSIVSIALRPLYFNAFYKEPLGDSSPSVSLGLTRADGEVLAWFRRVRPSECRSRPPRRCARRIAPAAAAASSR